MPFPSFSRLIDTIKSLMDHNTSDNPYLFPKQKVTTNSYFWSAAVFDEGTRQPISTRVNYVEFCKAHDSMQHEFVLTRISVTQKRSTNDTNVMIDRVPADNVVLPERNTPRNSSVSSLTSISSDRSSRTSSPSNHKRLGIERFNAITEQMGAGNVPALDRVFVPIRGERDNLDRLLAPEFGTYDVLCTLTIKEDGATQMSVPELAILLKVINRIAPNYTVRKHQCYWFAAMVYRMIQSRTSPIERFGKNFHKKGKLFVLAPNPQMEMIEIADGEYKNAMKKWRGAWHSVI
jgi:hypothetical protein